jgi:hypothetical protein
VAYLFKAVLGGGLFLGSVALFNVKLIALLETGTCASGNTAFEISRPCPEGTETDVLLLMVSVFTGLIGLAIFAARGRPPGAERRGGAVATGLWAWAIFFTATGAAALFHSLTSETIGADGKLGGAIVGATFLLMGLPALVLAAGAAIGQWRSRGESPAAVPGRSALPTHAASSAGASSGWISSIRPAPPGSPEGTPTPDSSSRAAGDDALARLERLQKLHETGALSDGEFQLQKARILNR